MIRVEHASFGYEKNAPIISDLNLVIRKGERVGLIGANGTGKSTFLKMLTGLLGHEGSIRVCGLEVEKKHLPETKMIASHDLDMILDTCDRVILMKQGQVRADGPAKEILLNKKILEECHLELPLRYQ